MVVVVMLMVGAAEHKRDNTHTHTTQPASQPTTDQQEEVSRVNYNKKSGARREGFYEGRKRRRDM